MKFWTQYIIFCYIQVLIVFQQHLWVSVFLWWLGWANGCWSTKTWFHLFSTLWAALAWPSWLSWTSFCFTVCCRATSSAKKNPRSKKTESLAKAVSYFGVIKFPMYVCVSLKLLLLLTWYKLWIILIIQLCVEMTPY